MKGPNTLNYQFSGKSSAFSPAFGDVFVCVHECDLTPFLIRVCLSLALSLSPTAASSTCSPATPITRLGNGRIEWSPWEAQGKEAKKRRRKQPPVHFPKKQRYCIKTVFLFRRGLPGVYPRWSLAHDGSNIVSSFSNEAKMKDERKDRTQIL